MEILQVIGQLFQFIASWVPRMVHIDVRHRGVRFVRGLEPKIARPGLRVYWPLTTELTIWPVISHTLQLESQSLRTRDGESVELRLRLVYSTDDPVLLLNTLYEPDDSIPDLALGAAAEVVCSHTLAEMFGDIQQTNRELLRATRRPLGRVGVRVRKAQVASLVRVTAIKHFGSVPVQEQEE